MLFRSKRSISTPFRNPQHDLVDNREPPEGFNDLIQNGHAVGYADISEATFGFQIGGEDFAELVVIQDAETMNKFKQGGYGMAAEASAVALKPGAAAHAQFKKGVAVFVLIKSGAMAEAAVAGQKFRYSAGDSDRDETNSHRRSEADTAGDRTRPITNISGSTSISTPNGGDAGVHGSTNVSGSTSVTTPNNGDRGVNSTDKRTTTTNGDGTKTTTTEEKTTTTK